MTRSHPVRWLALAAAGLVLAAFVGPRVVPLYDGLGFPDQPYQYTGATDLSAPPAEPAEQTFSLSDLKYPITLQTVESGPQFQVTFPAGSIHLSAKATEIKLTATPVAPSDSPGGGTISSNVYALSATTAGGAPTVSKGSGRVYLRLPQSVSFHSPPQVIFRKPGGSWSHLPTTQTGADIYRAAFSNWGEYALAVDLPTPAPAAGTTRKTSHNPALLAAALVIGIVAAALIAIRMRAPKGRDRHERR